MNCLLPIYSDSDDCMEEKQQNKIEDLINLDNYLVEQNTIFYINDKMIELCHSPYSNIKELARKFPASFSDVYQTKLVHIEPEVFDKEFFIYLEYVAHKSFANLDNQNVHNLFDIIPPDKILQSVFL